MSQKNFRILVLIANTINLIVSAYYMLRGEAHLWAWLGYIGIAGFSTLYCIEEIVKSN